MKTTASLCPIFWKHLVIMDENQISPCCVYRGEGLPLKKNETVSEAYAGEYFSSLRQKSLIGEKISGCWKCYEAEVATQESPRLKALAQWPNDQDFKVGIESVEIHLGNLCNLKCRGCNSMSSSRWISEEKSQGMIPYKNEVTHLSLESLDLKWSSIRHIKILGGEPFLIQQHEELLEKILSQGDPEQISLLYATNGTTRVSSFVLKAWEKMKEVEIGFSIDGLKEKNDDFRVGSSWQNIIENVQWFKESSSKSKMEFSFHTVVNNYNIYDIPEMDQWLMGQFPDFWMTKDCLIDPDWLNIRHLPEPEKVKLITRYENLVSASVGRKYKNAYAKIAHFLKTQPSGDWTLFTTMHERLHQR